MPKGIGYPKGVRIRVGSNKKPKRREDKAAGKARDKFEAESKTFKEDTEALSKLGIGRDVKAPVRPVTVASKRSDRFQRKFKKRRLKKEDKNNRSSKNTSVALKQAEEKSKRVRANK